MREDGRERRRREEPTWRTRRSCDGWPEIGSCSKYAMRGLDYCKECDALRRAHEGAPMTADWDEGEHD